MNESQFRKWKELPPLRRAQDARGLALLETVVMPVMVVLVLLGLMQFAYVFFVHHNMVSAARAAAHAAAKRNASAGDATSVAHAKLGGFPHAFNVQVQYPEQPGQEHREVRVSITTPMNGLSFGLFGDGDLRARVTVPCEMREDQTAQLGD